ncbi:MAG: hypothetical protein RSB82_03010 [Victivallaceae bacterium]
MNFGCIDCLVRKSEPDKLEMLFPLPQCSGTISLIALTVIGAICLFFGVCAVCILGCSEPGLIFGIVLCSLTVFFVVLAYHLYSKKTLVNKANERLSKQLKINERLGTEDRAFKNEIIARNAEDIKALLKQTTVICANTTELKNVLSLVRMNQSGVSVTEDIESGGYEQNDEE